MLKRSLQVSAMVRLLLALWLAITPSFVWAGSMPLTGVGGPGGGSVAFGLTYISDNTATSAGASSFTFTAQSMGTTDSTRIIIVSFAYHGLTANTVSSVTVGGNAASHATGAGNTTGSGTLSDIWYYQDNGALGTTANIVVNFAGTAGVTRCGVFVHRAVGTGVAFSAGNAGITNAGTSQNATVTVPVGGGTVGVVGIHSTAQTITNNSTPFTIDVNNLNPGSGDTYGAGHDTSSSGSTAFGFAWGTSIDAAMSVAAFSP